MIHTLLLLGEGSSHEGLNSSPYALNATRMVLLRGFLEMAACRNNFKKEIANARVAEVRANIGM